MNLSSFKPISIRTNSRKGKGAFLNVRPIGTRPAIYITSPVIEKAVPNGKPWFFRFHYSDEPELKHILVITYTQEREENSHLGSFVNAGSRGVVIPVKDLVSYIIKRFNLSPTSNTRIKIRVADLQLGLPIIVDMTRNG